MARDDSQDAPQAVLPPDTRIAAVVSRYHAELCDAMLDSARRELTAAGLGASDLLVVEAPGAFELPVLARRLALREDVDAVMCLGVVLKGETRHDEYIAQSVSNALQQVALATGRPVLFGVLTCETLEQARARALPAQRGGREDKGREVARAAIAVLAALELSARIGERSAPVGFQKQAGPAR